MSTASTHEAEHDHQGMQCCAHHEIKFERHIVLYLVGGVLLLATLIAQQLNIVESRVANIPAALAAIMLSIPMLRAAWQEISRVKPSSSTLAALAIIAAFANQNYLTAGGLAFILLVADQFVRRTAWGAQRAIEGLVKLTPNVARVIENGGEREMPASEVRPGQLIRVRPGENLPVDGVVRSGRSSINQASLTGEAMPHGVQPGEPVYAGTTNVTGTLEIEVTQVGGETTIGKVMKLIREAESTRTPRQLLIEQVAAFFVPVALAVAGIVWFITSQSADQAIRDQATARAITVLIVACPAALLLASPSAMVAAFASAARLGILIKQTNYLEAAANINTVVMDKTGTITTGSFEVSRLVPAPGVDGAELLRAAASAEQHSNHPLAQSIMRTARSARVTLDDATDYEEVHGRGVRARTTAGEVCVGRAKWILELHPNLRSDLEAVEAKIEGMSSVHVAVGGRYFGAVGLEDKVRPNTRAVIDRLRELEVRQIAIFTGDRLSVAKRVGMAVGVDAIEAECHPEEKHELITQYVNQGYRVMMVGDGINDGPSLAAAEVGVAMGLGGSDIATNSAGVALMNDDLSRIPFLIELARRTRAIIAQNIAASIVIVIIGLVLSALGLLAVPAAALYHFAGEVFVLGNSFRLFRFGEHFAEATHTTPAATIRRREASVRGLTAQNA